MTSVPPPIFTNLKCWQQRWHQQHGNKVLSWPITFVWALCYEQNPRHFSEILLKIVREAWPPYYPVCWHGGRWGERLFGGGLHKPENGTDDWCGKLSQGLASMSSLWRDGGCCVGMALFILISYHLGHSARMHWGCNPESFVKTCGADGVAWQWKFNMETFNHDNGLAGLGLIFCKGSTKYLDT